MTEGHKHRTVTLRVNTRLGGAVRAVLLKPRFHSTDLARVEASPYPYGLCREHLGCYYLSLLSILHRWTGLTLKEKTDG